MNQFEGLRALLFNEVGGECRDGITGCEAEDFENVSLLDLFSTEGDELIHHRLGITHSTVSTFGNGPCSSIIEGDILLSCDEL